MKSILAKLTVEEIKQLSKAINEVQKKNFGNPLSLRKQEQFMADVFEVKDWSTLLGISHKQYNPKSSYQKTTIQIEILSNEPYPTEYSLMDVHESIVYGECSGVYKEIARESLSKSEFEQEVLKQGTDPEFLINPNEEDEKTTVFNHLIQILLNENKELFEAGSINTIAEKLKEIFNQERDIAIRCFNRLNTDQEFDELSTVSRILCEDKITFSLDEIKERVKQLN